MKLEQVKRFVEDQDCLNCGQPRLILKFYPHEGGEQVEELSEKMWFYGECSLCEYQSSIVKLMRVARKRRGI